MIDVLNEIVFNRRMGRKKNKKKSKENEMDTGGDFVEKPNIPSFHGGIKKFGSKFQRRNRKKQLKAAKR